MKRITRLVHGLYIVPTIWQSDCSEDVNHSLRNIHFIQDESGTDKLTFTVNADHPAYDRLVCSMKKDKAVILQYCFKDDEPEDYYEDDVQTVFVDKEYEFFIVICDTDKLNRKKDITCASSMITLDWTPAMYKNFDGTMPALNQYSISSALGIDAITIINDIAQKVKEWHSEIATRISVVGYDSNLDGAWCMDMDKYGQLYSTLRNDLFEKSGLRIRRDETVNARTSPVDLYQGYSLESLQTKNDSDVIVITEPNAITGYNETEDITALYTHACGYVKPEKLEQKQGEVITVDRYRYRNDTVRVRSEEFVSAYGAKYLTSAIDKDSFKSDLKALKSAVKSASSKTSDISINPYVLIGHDIRLYSRVIVIDEDIAEVVALLITRADICLDDLTASSFEVDDITSTFSSVVNVENGRYDISDLGRSLYN